MSKSNSKATVLTNMNSMHASKFGKRAVEIILAIKCFPDFVLLSEEYISYVIIASCHSVRTIQCKLWMYSGLLFESARIVSFYPQLGRKHTPFDALRSGVHLIENGLSLLRPQISRRGCCLVSIHVS